MRKRVADLQPGDLVDLQGDKYADNGQHPEFEFQFCEVLDVERETADCVRVDFDAGSFGFPVNHQLTVWDLP